MPIEHLRVASVGSVRVVTGLFEDCLQVGGRGIAPELPKQVGLRIVGALGGVMSSYSGDNARTITNATNITPCIGRECGGEMHMRVCNLADVDTEEPRPVLVCDYCGGTFVWLREVGKFFWNGAGVLGFRG